MGSLPSCPWPRTSPSSPLPGRRSTRVWCATSAAASSWPTSATSCWWAAPARARRTWPSRSPGRAPDGARARFYTVVDLVNRLEAEARAGRQGRIADHLARLDLVVLDELGYLPFAQSGGQLLFHLISRLYETTLDRGDDQPGVRGVAERVCRRRQDDDGAARSADPPLRDRRDRQRELALQEPGVKDGLRAAHPGPLVSPAAPPRPASPG